MARIKKKICFNKDARQALIRGISTLAKAVTITLGPRGRNVGLGRKWNAPRVVHDGVSVAKEIEVEDPFEQMGIEMAKEAAEKTNSVAGDGTTTSILLTEAICLAGDKEIEDNEHDPMAIQRGLQKSCDLIVKKLAQKSLPVEDSKTISQIATVSSADNLTGEMISRAIEKVGKKGVIYVEEGKGFDTSIDYREGMEFDRGFMSSYFVTDDERGEAEVVNPYIFLTTERITTNKQLMPILNAIGDINKGDGFSVVVIADKVDYEALASMVVNQTRGTISAIPIEAPGFGDKREEILEDIATLTGGQVFSLKKGMTYDNINPAIFGRADKVWSNKDTSKIIGGGGDPEVIALRVKQLENALGKETSEFEKEKLEERIARLAGSVAIINVGATTETELHDKKERMVDAVAATKAAIAEGFLPGGGVTLLKVREALKSVDFGEEENIGKKILYDALRQPIQRLYQISGIPDKEVAMVERQDADLGYDVVSREYVNLLEKGIIDPTKVVRSSLQNAVSVAGTILTTEALVAVVDAEPDNNG